jgi:hypothetical protein
MGAAILEVILSISEDWSKEGWRVAAGEESVIKVLQVSMLVLHVLSQLEEAMKHAINHAFQDSRGMG